MPAQQQARCGPACAAPTLQLTMCLPQQARWQSDSKRRQNPSQRQPASLPVPARLSACFIAHCHTVRGGGVILIATSRRICDTVSERAGGEGGMQLCYLLLMHHVAHHGPPRLASPPVLLLFALPVCSPWPLSSACSPADCHWRTIWEVQQLHQVQQRPREEVAGRGDVAGVQPGHQILRQAYALKLPGGLRAGLCGVEPIGGEGLSCRREQAAAALKQHAHHWAQDFAVQRGG